MALLNTQEVAEILGVKPQTLEVWRHTKRYALPYRKIGRMVRYKEEDVLAFIEAQKNEGRVADVVKR